MSDTHGRSTDNPSDRNYIKYVSVQYLHRYDSQTHENRLCRRGFLTPESYSYGLISKRLDPLWIVTHYILTYILYSTHFIRKNQAFLPKNAWFFVLFSKKYTCFNRLCKRENIFFIFFFFKLIQITFIKMILHFLFFICADLC